MTTKPSDNFNKIKNNDGTTHLVRMRDGTFRDGTPQSLYLPNGRFKGMKTIIQEGHQKGHDRPDPDAADPNSPSGKKLKAQVFGSVQCRSDGSGFYSAFARRLHGAALYGVRLWRRKHDAAPNLAAQSCAPCTIHQQLINIRVCDLSSHSRAMRIAISDPSSSLLIPTSPIASANASGHPPAWANDSTSASVTPSLESSALTLSSAVSQSTLTSAVRTRRGHAHLNAVATHPTRRRHAPYTALHYESAVLCVKRAAIGVASERAVSTWLPPPPPSSYPSRAPISLPPPAQVSSTDPAQVSSTSSVGSIAPTGFTSASSTLSHTSRKGAIAGGIVGGIFVLLLLGFVMWFFRRCARKRAARRGLGVDADEKAGGVTVPKDEDSIESASSSPANPNPQERETVPAIGSPLPSSNVPAMPQTELAPPIPPTTSDSTAGSPLPNSNVPVMPQTDIAPPIPPPTSDSTAGSPLPSLNAPVMAQTQIAPPIPPPTSDPTTGSPLPNSNVPAMPQTDIAPPISPPTSDPTASWKYYITALPEIPLVSSKIVFAVDASDSTAGPIMQRQREFVLAMVEDYQLPHSVIMWGSSVEQPKSAEQISWDRNRDWGTKPEVIFDDAATTEELKAAIFDSPVNFARKALEVGMANTPVIFVITGTTLTSTTDISVGLPVFASAPDAAIVFKNAASGELYVVAARGAFKVLTAGYNINLANLNRKSLPFFPTESAFKNAMEGISIVDTARLKTGGAVYLGRAWHEKHQCFVRIDLLLEQMPPQSIPENELLDLLEDETFKELALSCKTRGLVQNLRDWLSAKNEQPRDMPAIHRPNPGNSPLLSRISRCLEKLTALENTGFNVDILEWSSHWSMSAAEAEPEVPKAHPMSAADAASSSDVDQKPKVLKAHSSTSTTGAQSLYNSRATRTSTFVESSTSRTQHSSYATTYTSW
ncbi:hypothetical protein B0H14DRAFT_3872184 [Mycena olivaceomarginata]|nr:hypothetical protein B0H14DRAFT_3872184 [Mycena olivaceomarginata]